MAKSAKDVMNELARESDMLKEVTDEEREKLKFTLKEMMKDIHAFCVNNNIVYGLVGGSCLGIVRHHGFIPWDDDIDIAMPRNSWNVFKDKFQEVLGDDYVMEAPGYKGRDTKTTWCKVYKRGTSLIEVQDIKTPFNNGIFIDVFVLDNVSDSSFVRKMDAVISDFMKGVATSMLYYKYPNELLNKFYGMTAKTWLYFKLRQFLGFSFSWCSHKRWCIWYDKFISRHSVSKFYTIPTGRKNYMGEIVPKDCFEPVRLMKFEDTEFFTFGKSDVYLKNLYGPNYMQIPPIDKRERHFVVDLKF